MTDQQKLRAIVVKLVSYAIDFAAIVLVGKFGVWAIRALAHV